VLKIMLGLVLMFSGIAKIVDSSNAVNMIIEFRIIPQGLIISIFSFLTVVEILTGLLLISGIYPKIAVISALVLFIGFFFISIYGTVVGLTGDCGCFGAAVQSRIGWGMVVRNGVFVVGAIYLRWSDFVINNVKYNKKKLSADNK